MTILTKDIEVIGDASPLAGFLRHLPRMLNAATPPRNHGHGGRSRNKPTKGISHTRSLSERATIRLMERLDCDHEGHSNRTGKLSWPESWPMAREVCQHIGAEHWMILILASWLEPLAPTTRQSYVYIIRNALRDMNVNTTAALARLPEQAALTWQREIGKVRLPRAVNVAVATLNSLMRHVVRLGLSKAWSPVPAIKITKGRHIDRDAVVLTPDQLLRFWDIASHRPSRQFLALLLASLHGLRAAEVAGLTWGAIRYRRRGVRPAPAVIHVIGKGRKHRMIQVHAAMCGWLESSKRNHDKAEFILADRAGRPPSPEVVSWWAKDVFRRAGIEGYGHALRATWTTMALEHRSNDAMQVQQSGGWKEQGTMLGHYFKRRNVPAIRLIPGHQRY